MQPNTPNRTATTGTQLQASAGGPGTPGEAGSQWPIGFCLAIVFLACVLMGYTVGKDVAIKHNYQDCVSEGRSDCQRLRAH